MLQRLSEWLVKFMNNELKNGELDDFKKILKLEKMNGPDRFGFLSDEDRKQLYEGLKNIEDYGKE